MYNRRDSYRGSRFKAHILVGLLFLVFPAGKAFLFAGSYSEGKSNFGEGQPEERSILIDTFLFSRQVLPLDSPCDLEAVNTITPNGDGINDSLTFEGIFSFEKRQLRVFNRWGEIVYENLNYKNNWEGTHKMEPLPAGTYLYVLRLKSGNQLCDVKGTVTIIR